jgi:hypothetical protein
MKFRPAFSIVLAVSALPACGKKDKPADDRSAKPGSAAVAAAPVTPPPAATGKPFEATLEGTQYKFLSAKIDNGIQTERLVLTTAAGGCATPYTTGDITLTVDLQPGPGGKHFAPGPLGVYLDVTSEKVKFAKSSLSGVINIEPGDWKVGSKVKGTLRFADADGFDDKKVKYTGSGSFEAEICALAGDDRYQAAPETVDNAPVTGNLAGSKFTFNSGVATLGKSKLDEDQITEIELFDTAVDCTSYKASKGQHVIIMGSGGASGKDVFIGTPQQRSFSFRTPDGAQNFILGPNWVKFDAIELKEGGAVKGSLYSETGTGKAKEDPKRASKLSGTFTVKVCN